MTTKTYLVIGAGAAGIASIGTLLDKGILPAQITWVDPEFNAGDLGAKWQAVPSNTKVGLFTKFLQHCESFNIQQAPEFDLFSLQAEDTCQLKYIVDPLLWLTKQLTFKVNTIKDTCIALNSHAGKWQAELQSGNTLIADKVILATGATPQSALFNNPDVVNLEVALTPSKLSQHVNDDTVFAVFGASHSAILVLKNLCELGAKKIINFYRNPLKYAVYYDDWILYDNTGLKGIAAKWAKENLENQLPDNLIRYESTEDNINQFLPLADKAIYAIGFQPRTLLIDGKPITTYNKQTGQIANDIYGVGIAFPEQVTDRVGNIESNVGLWKFITHLSRQVEHWTY